MREGFISIHREMLNHTIYNNSDHLKTWITILLLANHKDKEIMVGNQLVKLKRGQFITGRKKLANITGFSEYKIERQVRMLISAQQITQQTFTKYRVITVVNYKKWQGKRTTNHTTSAQQAPTTNNVNNENKTLQSDFSKKQDGKFNFSFYLKSLSQTGRRPDLRIIGHFLRVKGYSYENKDQANNAVKRYLKDAKVLKSYTEADIAGTMDYCINAKLNYDWQLSTVIKFIDKFRAGQL